MAAGVLTGALALIPLGACIGAGALATTHLGPRQLGWAGWVVPVAVSLVLLVVVERLARRLLPLAMLLRLTLTFPDRAPSRLGIALRTGTIGQLRRWTATLAPVDEETPASVGAERVVTLAAALNAHDRRTRGHSERVRALTDLLSAELGLDDHDRDKLRWGALLHDIGKLAVPPAILNKPGRPDADELATLRRHPAEGARLVGPLAQWLGDWAHAIDHHHERFDGGGYPYALAGTDISLAGRIVAVADAFDTMTSARSYKRAMSFTAARAELARCAGTHFDPAVVRGLYCLSLPRLVGALGPISLLAHVPLLASLGDATARLSGSAAAEAARTAAVATVSAAALAGVVAMPPSPRPAFVAVESSSPADLTTTTLPASAGTLDAVGSDSDVPVDQLAPRQPTDSSVPTTVPVDPSSSVPAAEGPSVEVPAAEAPTAEEPAPPPTEAPPTTSPSAESAPPTDDDSTGDENPPGPTPPPTTASVTAGPASVSVDAGNGTAAIEVDAGPVEAEVAAGDGSVSVAVDVGVIGSAAVAVDVGDVTNAEALGPPPVSVAVSPPTTPSAALDVIAEVGSLLSP